VGRGKQGDRKASVYGGNRDGQEGGVGAWGIVTGGVRKREGYSYIVIDIHLVGAHENLGFAHNLVKESQVIDPGNSMK
jgi:hypothetical protein